MNHTAIDIIGEKKCTGCAGCFNVCSFNAIEMKLSEEGFYKPIINKNKCTSCGMCSKSCPVIKFENTNYDIDKIKVYAGFTLDEQIRKESSSGGLFSEIANLIIEQKGVVFGAGWDESMTVNHVPVSSMEDVYKLRSSKYVQSNIQDTYKKINKFLEEGYKVLFVGVPCQVAALNNIVKNKSNLLTVDLVCHGVPSLKVFQKYLEGISKGQKINYFTFRDKGLGWSKYSTKAEMENGKEYSSITKEDPFFHGFICDLYLNTSCYDCRFSQIPRTGDITLGDFWKIPEELMDERGVSVIISNNAKGENIIKELEKQKKIKLIEQPLSSATLGNPRIENGHLRMREQRKECLKDIQNESFEYIYEKHIKKLIRYVY